MTCPIAYKVLTAEQWAALSAGTFHGAPRTVRSVYQSEAGAAPMIHHKYTTHDICTKSTELLTGRGTVPRLAAPLGDGPPLSTWKGWDSPRAAPLASSSGQHFRRAARPRTSSRP